jgi:hypothetical protein
MAEDAFASHAGPCGLVQDLMNIPIQLVAACRGVGGALLSRVVKSRPPQPTLRDGPRGTEKAQQRVLPPSITSMRCLSALAPGGFTKQPGIEVCR